MSDSSNLDHFLELDVSPDAEVSASFLNIPFSERRLSQLVPDRAHSYLDFEFPDETILGNNQAQIIGKFEACLFSSRFSAPRLRIYNFFS